MRMGILHSKPHQRLGNHSNIYIVLPRNASRHFLIFLASLDHVFELLNPLKLLKIIGSRWVASVCNP